MTTLPLLLLIFLRSGSRIQPLDRSLLASLADVVDEATRAYEGYDPARALERTEAFFWTFCDDYIELVKGRAYGDGSGADSARRALRTALDALLRLFAPVLPFTAEEVWSWWRDGSVHRQPWPDAAALRPAGVDETEADVLRRAAEVLGEVRKAKSTAKTSQRTPVVRLVLPGDPELHAPYLDDLRNAAVVEGEVEYAADGEVQVELGEAPAKGTR